MKSNNAESMEHNLNKDMLKLFEMIEVIYLMILFMRILITDA